MKKQGERLQLDCDISGYPAPIYKWYKNGVELPMNDGRLTIRVTEWGSRLVSTCNFTRSCHLYVNECSCAASLTRIGWTE